MDEELPVLHGAIGVFQVQRPGPDGLDLGAEQFDAGLIAVLHEVVVKRFPVLRGDFHTLLLRHGRAPS